MDQLPDDLHNLRPSLVPVFVVLAAIITALGLLLAGAATWL